MSAWRLTEYAYITRGRGNHGNGGYAEQYENALTAKEAS